MSGVKLGVVACACNRSTLDAEAGRMAQVQHQSGLWRSASVSWVINRIKGMHYHCPALLFLWLESHYIAQTGLEHRHYIAWRGLKHSILLPQPPWCWDYWHTRQSYFHFIISYYCTSPIVPDLKFTMIVCMNEWVNEWTNKEENIGYIGFDAVFDLISDIKYGSW